MKKINILVIGCGNLGSRYIQGMINVRVPLNIVVVDIKKKSLENSFKIWIKSKGNLSKHSINFYESLPKIPSYYKITIVSTSSMGRAHLVEKVSNLVKTDFWIIEKVLAQSLSELNILKKSIKGSKATWVNTPRRAMKWYKDLKLLFKNKIPYKMIKIGKNWNLASNSVHFIDLFSWYTNQRLKNVNTEKLNLPWFKSKRDKFYEINGELNLNFTNNYQLLLQSKNYICEDLLKIYLPDETVWTIIEKDGLAFNNLGLKVNGQLELQSKMTEPLINSILENSTCDLPTFEESYSQHAIFINSMLEHWNSTRVYKDDKIPIT